MGKLAGAYREVVLGVKRNDLSSQEKTRENLKCLSPKLHGFDKSQFVEKVKRSEVTREWRRSKDGKLQGSRESQ